MPDFNAKMYPNGFRLARWGSLQRSPDPLAGFKGAYFKGEGREGREGEGREVEGRGGEGSGGEGRGRSPQS